MTTQITCQKAVDWIKDKARFPLWGFRKIDGQRGLNIIGSMTTREHKPFGNPAITTLFSGPEYAGFDGEFTIDGRLNGPELCNKTGSILSQSKLKKGESYLPVNVVWNLFDYLHPAVVDLTYEDRYNALADYLRENVIPGVHLLPYVVINNVEEAQAFIDECLDLEYEGAIFRDPKAKHKSGRATAKLNDFWRFKPVSEKTAVVIEVEEGDKNLNEAKKDMLGHTERSSAKAGKVPNGMVGALVVRHGDGTTARVAAGKMVHDERRAWFEDQTQIVGWEIDYLSLDTGVKDAPRQARFVRRKLKVVP